MGASWFVSYFYYKQIDNKHKNWENTTSISMRISFFNNSKDFHRKWLQEVLLKNAGRLNTNRIGLSAETIYKMAKVLLQSEWKPY